RRRTSGRGTAPMVSLLCPTAQAVSADVAETAFRTAVAPGLGDAARVQGCGSALAEAAGCRQIATSAATASEVARMTSSTKSRRGDPVWDTTACRVRSSGDRARAFEALSRRFESCRAHLFV